MGILGRTNELTYRRPNGWTDGRTNYWWWCCCCHTAIVVVLYELKLFGVWFSCSALYFHGMCYRYLCGLGILPGICMPILVSPDDKYIQPNIWSHTSVILQNFIVIFITHSVPAPAPVPVPIPTPFPDSVSPTYTALHPLNVSLFNTMYLIQFISPGWGLEDEVELQFWPVKFVSLLIQYMSHIIAKSLNGIWLGFEVYHPLVLLTPKRGLSLHS